MGIKVMATQKGYYGTLHEPGALFTIKDQQAFSKKWMKKIRSKQGLAKARAELQDEKQDELPETEEDALPETFTEANQMAAKQKPKGEDWE